MRSTLNKIGFLTGAVLVCCTGWSQDLGRVEQIVQYYRDHNHFMGAVTISHKGQVVFGKSYGYANVEWQVPIGSDTRFLIGSITKQFTAAAILLLQEDGKLTTGDRIGKYLPNAPAAWQDITIRHLLTHTSGLPDYTGMPEFDSLKKMHVSPWQLVEKVASAPLLFQPGTRFEYRNANYVLLGCIIERASGKTYGAFLHDRIFQPLGMDHTGYAQTAEIIRHRAYGYEKSEKGLEEAAYNDMSVWFAAADLYSTVGDLLRWNRALYGGTLLKPNSINEMLSHSDSDAYGLGVQQVGHTKLVGHGGNIDGFRAALEYFPEKETSLIILSNVQGGGGTQIDQKLVSLIAGEAAVLPSERKDNAVPEAELKGFPGKYRLDNSETTLEVRLRSGHLSLQLQGHSPSELGAESRTMFFLKDAEVEVEFKAAPGANASELMVYDSENATATHWVRVP